MALGVPATTNAMRLRPPSTIQETESELDWYWGRLDLVTCARERLWDLLMESRDVFIKVVRRAPRDCPSGKVRWAIEVEEPESSGSILNRHPSVMLVYGRSLEALYRVCLEQAGCRVESAPDANLAMRLYQEHGPYDIVLTDLIHFREIFNYIRSENAEQAFAIVGSCGATGIRFDHKIPVLRQGNQGMKEGIRQTQLLRLVESAIKPKVRVLLVAGYSADERRARALGQPPLSLLGPKSVSPYGLWHLGTSHPESFEVELESNGKNALKRYRERGPYDMVLIDFRLPELAGDDLAMAIREENPAQQITMIMDSGSLGSSDRRRLGDIPVLNLKDLAKARKKEKLRRPSPFHDPGDGQALLDWVKNGLRVTSNRTKRSRTGPGAGICRAV